MCVDLIYVYIYIDISNIYLKSVRSLKKIDRYVISLNYRHQLIPLIIVLLPFILRDNLLSCNKVLSKHHFIYIVFYTVIC